MSILVVMEQRAGAWNKMSWETLAAAQQIGGELNQPVEAAVLGQDVSGLAAELAGKKLDAVHAVTHELLKEYTPDGYAAALRQLIARRNSRLVIFPHTYQVRDFRAEAGHVARTRAGERRGFAPHPGWPAGDGAPVVSGQDQRGCELSGRPAAFCFAASRGVSGGQSGRRDRDCRDVYSRTECRADSHQAARAVPRIAARRGSERGRDHRVGRAGNQRGGEYSDRAEAGGRLGRGAGGVAADLR